MSRFNPQHTSSPLVRSRALAGAAATPALNRPIPPPPEEIPPQAAKLLQQLTPRDVQVIDTIIERTPTAKTFVPVYKAYIAVLQELGIDSGDDATLYEYLLKLGLVKCVEWGDKWTTTKVQLKLGSSEVSAPESEPPPPPSPSPPFSNPAPLTSFKTPGSNTQPTRTSRFRARFVDDATVSNLTPGTDHPSETPEPGNASANLQRLLRKLATGDSSSTTGRTESSSIATPSSRVSNLANPVRSSKGKDPETPRPFARPAVKIAEPIDEAPSTRQPVGYRSRFATPSTPAPRYEKSAARVVQVKREDPAEPTKRPTSKEHPQRSGGSEPDTWKLIKMEKDADYFRKDRLFSKFFSLWRQNADWVRDTTRQISEARRTLALRECLEKWQEKTKARLDMTRRAARVDAYFSQRRILQHWRQVALKRHRQKWQTGMKRKVRVTRVMIDKRILRQFWERWRQSAQRTAALDQAEGFYDATVLHRCIVRWAQHLQAVRLLPVRALEFRAVRNKAILSDVFDDWKNRAELRVMERMTLTKRDRRIKKELLDRWKKDTHLHYAARMFCNRHILRLMFTLWKSKTKRVKLLERRANDYVRRQNRILLQAVHRVWVAKARGEQCMRVNHIQLVKQALSVWRSRVVEVQSLGAKATAFVQHADKDLLARAFQVIRSQVQASRENQVFAAQHYQKQLALSALAAWREATALRRKQARQARIARRYFVERSVFGTWRAALVQKRLVGLEERLRREKLRSVFQVWKGRFKKQIVLKRMGDVVRGMVEQRITYDALKKWIGAVVDNRLQTMQAADGCNSRLQRVAFEKWKQVKQRHQEDMSLLRSFQDVKREDMVRRVFQKWLSASRHAQRRRESLERKERQIRTEVLERAWDVWRDKFKEESLRPIENLVRLQAERSLVFSAFRLWESKSKALPALRLYAHNVRRKAFEKWQASLPSAKLARVAREFEKECLLRKMLIHWRERYQTRIGLKAVARARYLRLPPATTAPRPSVLSSAAASRTGSSSRPAYPSPSVATPSVHVPRATAISLLGRKAASERAASVPLDTRVPSPVTARARSRSPTKISLTPKSTPAAAPVPASRASLLSGFRVTPRPTRAGPFGSASPVSAPAREVPSTTNESGAQISGTPLSESPSRRVGRRFIR